ncbi:MAG: phosphagen kinase [Xanthomonadales bacterium]|nr:phosphagen kinase [Xanthomonadales bacterium]
MKNLNKLPTFANGCDSLLSKHLTDTVFAELKDKHTRNGFDLQQVINSGLINTDSSIGVYAGDKASYSTFSALFDPIIESYHGFKKTEQHQSNFNPNDLDAPNPDPENNYIISTRIRVARNLSALPLGSAISKRQRKIVERLIVVALNKLQGKLAGTYFPLQGMIEAERVKLVADHFLFKAGDRFLEAAGLNREWPEGRGIFHNDEKTFLVWVNEEDQLRMISMQMGGDIKAVFSRLSTAVAELETALRFSKSDHLGYITSCPSNLGTAMRASVHIKLPRLSKNMPEFEKIAKQYQLQIRGIHGEHSESQGSTYDISNRRRLGVTEVECVQVLHAGVLALINREKLF